MRLGLSPWFCFAQNRLNHEVQPPSSPPQAVDRLRILLPTLVNQLNAGRPSFDQAQNIYLKRLNAWRNSIAACDTTSADR